MQNTLPSAAEAQNNDNTAAFSRSAFYLQDVFPDGFSRSMTYDVGAAIGTAAGADHPSLRGFLLDAIVLSRRHPGAGIAAGLLGVSADGLRGFLDGAADHPLFLVEPDPQP